MYERRKAEIEAVRARLERELANHSADAKRTAEAYLALLTELIETVDSGPVADARIADLDTTGELNRAGEYETWAAGERTRVMDLISTLP